MMVAAECCSTAYPGVLLHLLWLVALSLPLPACLQVQAATRPRPSALPPTWLAGRWPAPCSTTDWSRDALPLLLLLLLLRLLLGPPCVYLSLAGWLALRYYKNTTGRGREVGHHETAPSSRCLTAERLQGVGGGGGGEGGGGRAGQGFSRRRRKPRVPYPQGPTPSSAAPSSQQPAPAPPPRFTRRCSNR